MRMPWKRSPSEQVKTEIREYGATDPLIQLLIQQAQKNALQPDYRATAALEICAGVIGRSFATCEVSGPSSLIAALTPNILEMTGRQMVRSGDVVFMIDMVDGMAELVPAFAHDIFNGWSPSRWKYRLSIPGPDQIFTFTDVPGAGVCHFRANSDPSRPWRGYGPIDVAIQGGQLSAQVALALTQEAAGPRGRNLVLPDNQPDLITDLKADIAGAAGGMTVLPAGDWGHTGENINVDGKTMRYGFEAPASMVDIHNVATREIMAACGVSPALFGGTSDAATREAYRILLVSVISPLGKIIEAELQAKLDPSITLSWSEMQAADIQGRSRSYASLVKASYPPQLAAEVAGLPVPPATATAEPEPVEQAVSNE